MASPYLGEFEYAVLLAAIHLGARLSAVDYIAAVNAQHLWTRQMLSWWHPSDGTPGFDLLVTPVLSAPPPAIGYLSGPQADERLRELMQFTAQFNVTGQPAISLPLLQSANGLPIGVQLVGPRHGDARLLRTARWLAAKMAES